MSIAEVVSHVNKCDQPLVLVTGGEPMAQQGAPELLNALAATRPIVQLETSGAFDVQRLPSSIHRIIDIKTPASGECDKNIWGNISTLHAGDEIKFVVCDKADYQWCRKMILKYSSELKDIPVLLSPVWSGEYTIPDLVKWMLNDRVPARLQLQLHKFIWGPEVSGI